MNQEKSQENTEKEKRKERPFIVENKGITSEKMQRKKKQSQERSADVLVALNTPLMMAIIMLIC